MPMSDYIRGLRDRIGTTVLEVPTVSVLVFDERERILLVRHVEGNDWKHVRERRPGGVGFDGVSRNARQRRVAA